MSSDDRRISGFTAAVYACQFFYGGWFLFHGLNFWTQFYADGSIRPGPGLIPALVASGLMTVVKVLEICIGLLLLADLFVPLTVIAAFPITLVIAYVNMSHLSPFGICVGLIIIALNVMMALGHLDRYAPILVARAGPPTAKGIDALRGAESASVGSRSLAPAVHILAIVLGIAAAAGVTFATAR